MKILKFELPHKPTSLSSKKWKKQNPALVRDFKKLQELVEEHKSKWSFGFSILAMLIPYVPYEQKSFLLEQAKSLKEISLIYLESIGANTHSLDRIMKNMEQSIKNPSRSQLPFLPGTITPLFTILKNSSISFPLTLSEYCVIHN